MKILRATRAYKIDFIIDRIDRSIIFLDSIFDFRSTSIHHLIDNNIIEYTVITKMTFATIQSPAFLASGVYNLESSRFRCAPLDSRQEGWTEKWGRAKEEEKSDECGRGRE